MDSILNKKIEDARKYGFLHEAILLATHALEEATTFSGDVSNDTAGVFQLLSELHFQYAGTLSPGIEKQKQTISSFNAAMAAIEAYKAMHTNNLSYLKALFLAGKLLKADTEGSLCDGSSPLGVLSRDDALRLSHGMLCAVASVDVREESACIIKQAQDELQTPTRKEHQ